MTDSRTVETSTAARDLVQNHTTDLHIPPPLTLKDRIYALRPVLEAAIPAWSDLNAQQIYIDSYNYLRLNPRVRDCDHTSVIAGITTCAQLGLRLGVGGQAYLVPYRDWKTGTYNAAFVVGYLGYIELAHRSGQIKAVRSHLVYEGDTFGLELGDQPSLTHRPELSRTKRGHPIGAYALAEYTAGGFEVEYLDIHDIDEIGRMHPQCSRARHGHDTCKCPWNRHRDAMRRKTLVRRLAKWLPKTPELSRALDVDETVAISPADDENPGEVE